MKIKQLITITAQGEIELDTESFEKNHDIDWDELSANEQKDKLHELVHEELMSFDIGLWTDSLGEVELQITTVTFSEPKK